MTDDNNILNNGVFCVHPWIHFATMTNGDIRPCSWGITRLEENGIDYNVTDHDIINYSESQAITELKNNMLAGKKSKYCTRCYEQEELNGISKRTVETFKFQPDVAEDIINNKEVPVKNIELRLGNRCNIGCVSCSPAHSDFFIRELNKLGTDVEKLDITKKYKDQYLKFNNRPINWFTNPIFWDKLYSFIPNVEYIYLAGGEPTIIKENWEFLDRIVKTGYAKNIKLGISTNLTNVQPRHIEIYNSFKECSIYCSIDAYGKLNDYIRFPSKWSSVSKNFEELVRECNGNVNFKVIPVISIFSIWSIEKLWSYTEEIQRQSNKDISFGTHTLLRDPSYLSMRNLPDSAKKELMIILERIANKYADEFQVNRLYNYVNNSIGLGDESVFYNGRKHIETYDKIRKNSWKEYVPELKKWWKDD